MCKRKKHNLQNNNSNAHLNFRRKLHGVVVKRSLTTIQKFWGEKTDIILANRKTWN
jgi:hypothetical protein